MPRLSLTQKLILIAIIPSVSFGFVFSYTSYVQSTNQATENGKKEAISVADLAVESLKDPIYYFDMDGVNDIIANLQYNQNFRNIHVLYPDGRVMTDGTKENPLYGQPSELFTEKVSLAGSNQMLGRIVEIDAEKKIVCILFPIMLREDASLIGFLQADVGLEGLKEIENTWFGTFAMITILAGSMATGILVFASKSIVEPISKLRKGAAAIAAGNYQQPVTDSQSKLSESADEVQLLSHDLEMMRQKIAEASDNLEKKVLERTVQLQRANEKLESLDKLKNEFISIAAHEIRNPIQPILMFSDLAQRGNLDPMKALVGIYAEARRLKQLTDDLLDVTKIEGGMMSLDLEVIDLNKLVETVVEAFEVSAARSGVVKLEREIERFESEVVSQGLQCLADNGRLKQVLTNIIGNAVKFTERGTVRVRTSFLKHEYRFVIEFIDSGRGISPEIMPRLFEKFATKDVAGINKNGTGLGLYVSKAIIEAHAGEITASNNPDGAGAIFSIFLPASSQFPKDKANHLSVRQSEFTAAQ